MSGETTGGRKRKGKGKVYRVRLEGGVGRTLFLSLSFFFCGGLLYVTVLKERRRHREKVNGYDKRLSLWKRKQRDNLS